MKDPRPKMHVAVKDLLKGLSVVSSFLDQTLKNSTKSFLCE
jgi:hypothetical protein